MERPSWCLDETCRCICRSPSPTGLPGESQFCTGLLDETLVTERGGVRHENDGRFCLKTPRGITMFEINENDSALFARLHMRALVARDESVGFNARWYTGRDDWSGPQREEAGDE